MSNARYNLFPSKPAFRARSDNNTQSLTNDTNTVVIFDVAQTNLGGCYNTSNGKFTAPVDGFYSFNASLLISQGGADRVDLMFYKNGGVELAHEFRDTGSISTNASFTAGCHLELVENDFIECVVKLVGASGSVYSEPKFWNFSGHLVS